MRIHRSVLALLFAALASLSLSAQGDRRAGITPEAEQTIHQELIAFREGLTDAVVKGDVDRQLTYAHKDVVVTWHSGEVCRGHEGLADFLKRNQSGSNRIFQGYKVPPTPKEKTILYGNNTGISYGTSVGQYKLLGKDVEMESHWSATLVKEDGRWLIASYHVSANALDNPLLNSAKGALYWVGGIGLVVGLGLGILGTKLIERKRRRTA